MVRKRTGNSHADLTTAASEVPATSPGASAQIQKSKKTERKRAKTEKANSKKGAKASKPHATSVMMTRKGGVLHALSQMRNDPEAVRRAFETGAYPYTFKMKRAIYEKHKAELQVELLKVQNWVQNTGERIVMLFEGRDAAGKGGPSSASWSTSIRAAHGWLRSPNQVTVTVPNGSSSAISNTSPRQVRS